MLAGLEDEHVEFEGYYLTGAVDSSQNGHDGRLLDYPDSVEDRVGTAAFRRQRSSGQDVSNHLLREREYTPLIPVYFNLGVNLWAQHGADLIPLLRRYPDLFPQVPAMPRVTGDGDAGRHEKTTVTDHWGTVREFIFGGIDGYSKTYPLVDLAALETYQPPNPMTHAERALRLDWDTLCATCAATAEHGGISAYFVGEFNERLYYLRGYENYLMDLVDEPPELPRIIELILNYQEQVIAKCIECGVNLYIFHDDLGNKTHLMMSPAAFRKWLKPGYRRLWGRIKEAGQYVYLHSDGTIWEVLPDLIEVGLDVINPQVALNGIDRIAEICKGRVCINADLDDQDIIPYGTPADVREHVKEVVMKLGSKEGGLGLEAKLIGPASMENLEALFETARQWRDYYV